VVLPATLIAVATTLVALATTAPPATAQAADPPHRASLTDLEDEVMCIVCGVPLELATDAPQANQERDFIRQLIAEGKTKDQIKDALVAQYGENVLATPDTSGFDLAAWLVPGLGILAAALAIGFGVWRWRRETRERDEESRVGEREATVDQKDSDRLEADLSRYDL
jgi:cytochrome c-type biogenesis protein CcmH/NrfF